MLRTRKLPNFRQRPMSNIA